MSLTDYLTTMLNENTREALCSGVIRSGVSLNITGPKLITICVQDVMFAIRALEEECELTYDDMGIVSKIIEMVKDEAKASQKLADYIDYHTYKNSQFGIGFEQQEFLKSITWMTCLLLCQLKANHLYHNGKLPYVIVDLTGNRLTLMHTSVFKEVIKHELDNP